MSADIVQARYTELEGVAGRFAGAGERVQEVARSVQGRADVLRRGGWEGHGQAAFLAELDALVLPALGRLVAALGEAGDVMQQMRQVIQLAEEEAARLFDVSATPVWPVNESPVLDGNESSLMDAVKWIALLAVNTRPWAIPILDLLSTASSHRGYVKAGWLAIGRALNELMNSRGFVGIMKKGYDYTMVKPLPYRGVLDTVMRSKAFARNLAIADAFLGLLEDLQTDKYQGDWGKAIGVNSIDGGLQVGVAATGAGAVALVINSANQLLGMVETGAMRFYADKAGANDTMTLRLLDDAKSMEAAYKKMDLTNITKELGEAIWDGYGELLTPHRELAHAYWNAFTEMQREPSLATLDRVLHSIEQTGRDNQLDMMRSTLNLAALGPLSGLNTDAGWRGIGDTLRATGNVVDGLVDAQIIRFQSSMTLGTNLVVQNIEYAPVSDAMKQRIRESAMEIAKIDQMARRWTTNLVEF